LTLLIPQRQLILSSGAFFPPVAFDCLALPPACCVPDRGHCDVEEAEAELCCGHDDAVPELRENSVSVCALPCAGCALTGHLPSVTRARRVHGQTSL
jgi:hypothetical protein